MPVRSRSAPFAAGLGRSRGCFRAEDGGFRGLAPTAAAGFGVYPSAGLAPPPGWRLGTAFYCGRKSPGFGLGGLYRPGSSSILTGLRDRSAFRPVRGHRGCLRRAGGGLTRGGRFFDNSVCGSNLAAFAAGGRRADVQVVAIRSTGSIFRANEDNYLVQ